MDDEMSEEQLKSYKQAMEKLGEMAIQLTEKRCSWFRHLMLLTVTLFGILIFLHAIPTASHSTRWCFALTVALFSLGILAGSLVVYSEVKYLELARKMYLDAALKAFRGNGKIEPVIVPSIKLFDICEKVFYVSIGSGLLMLTVYSLMTIF